MSDVVSGKDKYVAVEVMDKHLDLLSRRHIETRFVKVG